MSAGGSGEFARSPRDLPGPRDRILDIFGLFVRDSGGWIAVAHLLELLELLGVTSGSARSALSRMKRREELLPLERAGVRGYMLTEAAEAWFADGTARIMGTGPAASKAIREGGAAAGSDLAGTGPATMGAQWVIASFTVPEGDRHVRYRIRSRLSDLGFGQLGGGLMIAPAHIGEESIRALQRAGLTDFVDVWDSAYLGLRSVEDVVASAWDLPAIAAAYHEYLSFVANLDAATQPANDDEAFVRYVHNVNAWRELPFMDPGIPSAYLPGDWPATTARSVFDEVSDGLRDAAWRHFERVVEDERKKTI